LQAREKSTHHWRVRLGDLEHGAHERALIVLAIAGPHLLENHETSAAIGMAQKELVLNSGESLRRLDQVSGKY